MEVGLGCCRSDRHRLPRCSRMDDRTGTGRVVFLDGDANSHAHNHADANIHPDRHTDANIHPNSHVDPNAEGHTDPYANPDPHDADTRAIVTNADARADPAGTRAAADESTATIPHQT